MMIFCGHIIAEVNGGLTMRTKNLINFKIKLTLIINSRCFIIYMM